MFAVLTILLTTTVVSADVEVARNWFDFCGSDAKVVANKSEYCCGQCVPTSLSTYFIWRDTMNIQKGNTYDTSLITNLPTTTYGNNTLSTNASEFLQLIMPVVKKILSLSVNQLSPSTITNSLFTSLVNLICVEHLNKDEISLILSNNAILNYQRSLMDQCSQAEYFLEANFAEEIKSGKKNIEDFIYYNNYESLVQFEMESLKIYSRNISVTQVAVIGSGPLPLTSVEILKHLPSSVIVTNYDHSEEAVTLGRIVVKNNDRIIVKNGSALKISANDLKNVGLVYLAALVGMDKDEKREIVEHLYNVMIPGSVLIGRSAVGLKTLIYRRLTNEEFGKFSDIQEFHPQDKQVLNSIMCGTR